VNPAGLFGLHLEVHGGVVVHELWLRGLQREHLGLQGAGAVPRVGAVNELRGHAPAVVEAGLLAGVLADPVDRPHAGAAVVEVDHVPQRHEAAAAVHSSSRAVGDRRGDGDAAAVGAAEVDGAEVGGVGAAALQVVGADAVRAADGGERAADVRVEAQHVEDGRPPAARPPLVQPEVPVVLQPHVLHRAGGGGGEPDAGKLLIRLATRPRGEHARLPLA
jgi:hypothetical protein